jgi:hypothetical protein
VSTTSTASICHHRLNNLAHGVPVDDHAGSDRRVDEGRPVTI